MSPKIVISVSNDLTTDQRVKRTTDTIHRLGYEVVLLGRKLPNSSNIERDYRVRRFKLTFNKGPLFYLNLNWKLFFALRREKPDVQLANDLDTLLSNYLYHLIAGRKTKLVYDSHEYFTEVPELIGRPSRKIWLMIERWIFPKLKKVFTVSPKIAQIYTETYKVPVSLVRNLPQMQAKKIEGKHLPTGKKLIYQGAVNVNRGIELMIKSLQYLPDYLLYVFGDGDVLKDVKKLTQHLKLEKRVVFMGRVEPDELRSYTEQCQLGLSFEEKMGKSYEFALPNKVFDYIHGHVPVLVSDLTQMKDIVERYEVGEVLKSRNPEQVAKQISELVENPSIHQKYVENCKVAKQDLCWENEEKVLEEIFRY